eukprot:TRINITY_DN12163_c1_g1_i1.p1 TRINITY_DN12163_c1_g1~~TRINITY_DN12163_c1_g1_i1.p1  ORF type:complete len:406 (-),score=101.91 TRINITY_DN12163_c1_g1_i1:980-2197(-)
MGALGTPRLPPALLIRMSREPKRSTAASARAWTESAWLTSQVTPRARPPSSRLMASALASTNSGLTSARTTLAPSAARALAKAVPNPPPPPVTMAHLSLNLMRRLSQLAREHASAAGHLQGDAGDPLRLVRGQEGRGIGHVLGLARPGHHQLLGLGDAGVQLGGEFGGDEARQDGVGGDVVLAQLAGGALGKADHARLGRGVAAVAVGAALARAGGYVDNAAPVVGHHDAGCGPGAQKGAPQVDREHLVPLLGAHLVQHGPGAPARVVHPDVHAAEMLRRLPGSPVDAVFVDHVHLQGQGAAAQLFYLAGHLLGSGQVQVGHRHVSPLAGQNKTYGAADPPAASSHQGDSVLHCDGPFLYFGSDPGGEGYPGYMPGKVSRYSISTSWIWCRCFFMYFSAARPSLS